MNVFREMVQRVARRRTLRRACLLLCLLLVAAPARARQERPPFEFAEAEALSLPLKQGTTKEVRVLNNTARRLSLAVNLVDGEAAAGGALLSSCLKAEPETLEVPESGSGTVVLSFKQCTASGPGATPTGYLVVSHVSTDTVKRRPVKLSSPGKADGPCPLSPPPAGSLVGSVKATAYCSPLDDGCDIVLDEPLPLSAKDEHDELAKRFKGNPTLGWLTTERGETALLTYKGEGEVAGGETTGLKLGFKSDGAPGEYKGRLSGVELAGAKPTDDKSVSLIVVSKHRLRYAVLVVLAGILTFYLMQWYLNVLRKVSVLAQQEAEVEATFERAERRFKTAAAGREYEGDSIRSDFDAQAAALSAEIGKLRFDNFVRLDENSDAFKNVVARLKALAEVAESWGAFAESRLNPLADKLAAAEPAFARRPPDETLQQTRPQLVLAADKLLAGVGDATIARFKERAAKADELAPRVSSWPSLNEEAARVFERLGAVVSAPSFAQMEPIKQEDVRAKKDQAFLLWRTLWTRENFDSSQVEASLDELEDFLAVLAGQSLPPVATAVAAAAPKLAAAAPAERAERIGRIRLGLDLFTFFLAIAVAVYTVLSTFYFDHPFGTARDYVAAFVTGLGTKPAVEAVIGALNRFMIRPA